MLTYSRPKGEYKAEDAVVAIDFWLLNAKLRARAVTIGCAIQLMMAKPVPEKWEPIWLSGWISGKHRVKLELVDKAGNVVDNGGYN